MTSKIGKYELLRKVGTGGSGTVFEAQDVLIRRTVALKTCEAKDPEVRARFFQEAQLGGSLRHRNITAVYDFGVENGMPYIVQEFLDGEDLDRIIARPGSLPLIEKLRILIGIAYGLEYAHRAGIIHRDVKPRNIRILSDRTVKLMDFGISRLEGMGPIRTGRNLGTLAYLAPERILEQPVDARADVFSFGVVAYELLSGQRPFDGEIEEELFERIVKTEPAPLSEVARDVPAVLASIVDCALRKKPEDRYPSIEPMRKALVATLHELFGPDAPMTAEPIQTAAFAEAFGGAFQDAVGDTREVPDKASAPAIPMTEPEPIPLPAIPEAGIPPAARPTDPTRHAAAGRRFTGPVLAAGVLAGAVLGVVVGRSFLPGDGGSPPVPAPAAAVPGSSRAESRQVPPASAPDPSSSAGSVDATGSSPEAAGLDAAGPRSSSPRLRNTAPSPRRESKAPASIAASPGNVRATSRYARAADEPGLSSDTRAAIYLSGAWELYRSGDLSGAREMLRSAYALRRELAVDPNQYDAGFRRLANRVREGANRSS